jgi:hypothetical protein
MERFAAHPARTMSIRSMEAAEAGDRAAWLALFAPDGYVEDPVGPSPFDPQGLGHRGLTAIGVFWDDVIALGKVRFTIRESYAAGPECANVGTITTTLPDGTRALIDGVFTYRIDGAGHLLALRAVWEFDQLRLEEPDPTSA